MDFRVELSTQAQSDISSIHDWLRSQSAGETGERWFVALRTAIATLKQVPSRCPLAPEGQDSPTEVRQLLYGRRPNVYRILFAIEGDVVQVLHIRHGRRRPVAPPTKQAGTLSKKKE